MIDGNQRIKNKNIEDEMKKSYLDYAMSVIVSRALPDVRDGLKPVHRRILYAMEELNMSPDKQYRKSARVVGDVLGKYHPHGDSSVYGAMVRLAQDFNTRYLLVDGHGNFGAIEFSAASSRYTEMRMEKLANEFFGTIGKKSVDFRPNYDGTLEEPTVLPLTFPNILVNGTDGIAVGMATSIPTHNLGEVIDAFLAYVKDQGISVQELMQYIPAPDFPTGGIVHGLDGYYQALQTGRGSVKLRGEWHEESRKGGASKIVITELPWRVNRLRLQESIATLVKDKKIEDIVGMTDESAKGAVRLSIDVAKGTSAEIIVNQLFAMTELEISISYNMMLLLGQQPFQMGIQDIFKHFLDFRLETILRATQFDLDAAEKRLHIYDGYIKALDKLDKTIAIIRESKSREIAKQELQKFLGIDEEQTKAILELQLQRLTGMDIGQIRDERNELIKKTIDLKDIIARKERRIEILTTDALLVKEKFADPRRTTIAQDLSTITTEDLVPKEDVIILRTNGGYIKRIPVTAFSSQNRGTRGKSWMSVGDDDEVAALITASSHDHLLAFTADGQLYGTRAYSIPEGVAGTKGRHIKNILDKLHGDVVNVMSVSDFDTNHYLLTVSAKGTIKRTDLSVYPGATRSGGIAGVKINEDDHIVGADIVQEHDHVILVSSGGKAIRFEINNENLRPMGRNSAGNRGIKLGSGEEIIGLVVLRGNGKPLPTQTVIVERLIDGKVKKVKEQQPDTSSLDAKNYLFVVGENGVGKKTQVEEFIPQSRGGKGTTCFNKNKKTGNLIKALLLTNDQDIILTTKKGITNRLHADAIRTTGRVAAGSRLITIDGGDTLVAVSPVVRQEEE